MSEQTRAKVLIEDRDGVRHDPRETAEWLDSVGDRSGSTMADLCHDAADVVRGLVTRLEAAETRAAAAETWRDGERNIVAVHVQRVAPGAKTPATLRNEAEAKLESLRESVIRLLASDGTHGLYSATQMIAARDVVEKLLGEVDWDEERRRVEDAIRGFSRGES